MAYLKRYGIVLVVCLISLGSNAFIYEAKVLRKWDPQRGRYHYFIGCSDFHDKVHEANKGQLAQIEHVLERCNKDTTKVLVEDLSSRNNQGRLGCGRFYVNSRGGILGGLSDKCDAVGLDVCNVEFRYCRVTSLGPVLNNLNSDYGNFPSVASSSVATIMDEITGAVNEVRSYDDGKALNQAYQRGLRQTLKELKALHMPMHKNETIARYLETHTKPSNRLGVLKKLLTFDSGLLDLKLAHQVVGSLDKEKIVAIAGGTHIANVSELLQKVGYEPVHATDVTFWQEHNLKRCLGSHIVDGAYCVKPEPIALDFLDEFIG